MKFHLLLTLFLCFFISNFLLAQNSGTISTITPIDEINTNGFDGARKFVRDSAGNLFIPIRARKLQTNGKGIYQIFVYKSTNNGLTWSTNMDSENKPIPVANISTGHARVAAMAIDSKSTIHIVWYQNDSLHMGLNERVIKYSRSTNQGLTWEPWKNIGDPGGYPAQDSDQIYWQEHPVIAIDNMNRIFVAWESHGNETNGNPVASKVGFTKSLDTGRTWAPITYISSNSGATAKARPAIIVNHTGRVFVFHYGKGGNPLCQRIWMNYSGDYGNTWMQNWVSISNNNAGDDARHISVAMTTDSKVHIVWRQDSSILKKGSRIYYRSCTSTGVLSNDLQIIAPTTDSVYQLFPNIAADNKNKVHIVYAQTTNTGAYPDDDYPGEFPKTGDIYYVNNVSGVWSQPKLISSGQNNNMLPTIRFSRFFMNGGTLNIAWVREKLPREVTPKYDLVHYNLPTNALKLATSYTFIAQKTQNRNIKVEWAGVELINYKTWTLQHSSDEKSFSDLISTSSLRNNSLNSNFSSYSYTHTNIKSSNNFYRLKLLGNDDQITYSNIINIKIETEGILVYPNPTKNTLTIDLAAYANTNYKTGSLAKKCAIFSMSGILIKTFVTQQPKVTIVVNDLPKGTYLLQVDEIDKPTAAAIPFTVQ